MDLETETKLRFLNHEDPRAWFLTDLEHGLILGYFYSEPLVSTIVVINPLTAIFSDALHSASEN